MIRTGFQTRDLTTFNRASKELVEIRLGDYHSRGLSHGDQSTDDLATFEDRQSETDRITGTARLAATDRQMETDRMTRTERNPRTVPLRQRDRVDDALSYTSPRTSTGSFGAVDPRTPSYQPRERSHAADSELPMTNYTRQVSRFVSKDAPITARLATLEAPPKRLTEQPEYDRELDLDSSRSQFFPEEDYSIEVLERHRAARTFGDWRQIIEDEEEGITGYRVVFSSHTQRLKSTVRKRLKQESTALRRQRSMPTTTPTNRQRRPERKLDSSDDE